ncbi:AraC family transcriptional regulator [Deinococcus rubellus]|uniref:Helix-turn-helix domain-containing protein n=1 Tax=Deinococcus rubellus TaxID=1889240 RepID=A0ABY5YHX9_9DEIO|nr:helix-turn-helix domain-containing protein [Deinococcus rubellus]UWX64730.1 helix-turn-helix domain-containing protein [Deinococcus rubellus]
MTSVPITQHQAFAAPIHLKSSDTFLEHILSDVTVMLSPSSRSRLLWPDAHIDLVIQVGQDAAPFVFSPGLQWSPERAPSLSGPAIRLRFFPWMLPQVTALTVGTASVPASVLAALTSHDAVGAMETTCTWLAETCAAWKPDPLALAGIALLTASGRVPSAALEDLAQTSERALQRLCRSNLGCSLTGLQRLIRFERTLLALFAHPVPLLALLAVELGFADQAHLSREVRRFTGRTPLALWREIHSPEFFKTPAPHSVILNA